ncbi:MAG: orotate phosphoribosyltransferase [Bacteroidota bacterium]
MKTLKNTAEEIAKKLLQIKAIKLSPQNPFTWASGMKSPIYCDNRILLSYPEIRSFVIQAMVKKVAEFDAFDVIAGVATAGIAHGALLAAALDKPFVYVRSKAKGHGRQNLIEGELRSGQRVLVVEDLISTGGSCIKAVEAIRERDCTVVGVLAIFTYGFDKSVAAFETINCNFKTLTDYNTLIREAEESAYIEADDVATLSKWNKAPEKW